MRRDRRNESNGARCGRGGFCHPFFVIGYGFTAIRGAATLEHYRRLAAFHHCYFARCVSHSSDYGGWNHSTQVGEGGVAHESNYGGAWHGTAATPYGAYHGSDYGGYYHGTTTGPYGASHTGYYGTTTTSYGAYYHQPVTANYYGAGCYNCGGGGWGVAAGAAVGAATGVAIGAAATSAAYAASAPPPAAYAALPTGCVYRLIPHAYECGAMWLAPAYGSNGIYYKVVPAP